MCNLHETPSSFVMNVYVIMKIMRKESAFVCLGSPFRLFTVHHMPQNDFKRRGTKSTSGCLKPLHCPSSYLAYLHY